MLQEILNTTESEAASAATLTSVIERDHAISVRVLRIANSAFYGQRHPVDTLRDAVVTIGFNAVRLLALATSVFDSLSRRNQFALDPQDFWMHSFGAAKAAQLLARMLPNPSSADVCFTGGLIHDMGKYLLALALQDEYQCLVQEAVTQRRPLRDLEAESLGTTSGEVGGWLAERWGLPERLVTVVENHQKADRYTGDYQTEVVTIALSDQFSCVAGFGLAGEFGGKIDDRLVRLIGLRPPQISDALQQIHGHLEETRCFIHDMGSVQSN